MIISTEYPLIFFLFCLLLGLLYAVVLYYKNRNYEFSPWINICMAFFRFLLICIISFLLLSPLLKTTIKHREKPIIILAHDNSESIAITNDSVYYNNDYINSIKKLSLDLQKKFKVKEFTFGESVQSSNGISFSEKQTDISSLFNEIKTKYQNRNIGALIMFSDGLYNKGLNPLYSSKGIDFPIYALALGDTNVRKDLILSDVNYNRLIFYGNNYPVNVVLKADKCKGLKTNVFVKHNNKIIYKHEVEILSNNFIKTIPLTLKANDIGIRHYEISIESVKGEISISNNSKDVFVDIIDSRQKILLLANSPHPDISAITSVLEQNDNYIVEEKIAGEDLKAIDNYDLVIFHQIPSMKFPAIRLNKEISEKEIPVLHILGSQLYLNLFNKLNHGIKIFNWNKEMEETLPSFNENFSLFNLNNFILSRINNFPPLNTLYGKYEVSNSSNILLYQKSGNVIKEEPLIIINQNINSKQGVILGEGLWRWKLFDYLKNNDNNSFNELITKIVQYLSLKTDKSYFRVYSENEFDENQDIKFKAELYNKSYELINDPEIEMFIFDENDKKFPFIFSRKKNAYILNAGSLQPGLYKYQAKANFMGELFEENGEFIVSSSNIEEIKLVADHNLLFKISANTGGKVFYPEQIRDIPEIIEKREDINSIVYSNKSYTELIDVFWILISVIVLLTVEWFLRRRSGGY